MELPGFSQPSLKSGSYSRPIPKAPSLDRSYPVSTVLRASPPPQAARPIPRGCPVEGHAPSPLGVSRVALDLRVPTCRRHYPGGPLGSDRSWGGLFQPFPIHPQRRRPSPSECEVGVHIGRFEACSTCTCVTACRLAASPKRHICLEGSDGFVTSTAAPIATGWSDPVAGWELHPLKTNTFLRRTLGLAPRPPFPCRGESTLIKFAGPRRARPTSRDSYPTAARERT